MPRTNASVIQLPGPLLGLATHLDARRIGPTRAQDCREVTLIDGRLKKRFGIVGLLATPPLMTAQRVEGIYGLIKNKSGEAPSEIMVVKTTTTASSYASGKIRFYLGSTFDAPDNTEDTLSGNVPLMMEVGSLGSDYGSALFILDGSARGHKVPANGNKNVYRIGLSAPTSFTVEAFTAIGTGYTVGTFEWRVSLSDRDQVPTNNTRSPGLESNATDELELQTIPDRGVRLEFVAPDPTVEYWTHANIYRRETTAGVNETNWLYVGRFARGTPATGEGQLTDQGGGTWRADIDDDPDFGTPATGTGFYDHAPTRNNVPTNMDYFVAYRGIGLYARNDEPLVYLTDNLSQGGHLESINNEFLPPFDGPISLLAYYRGSVMISTTNGLYRMTGVPSQLSNYAVALGLSAAGSVPQIERLDGTLGAVHRGVGQSIVAGGSLYYVTQGGLVRFDGQSTVLVSKAIEGLLNDGTATTTYSESTLSHDSIKGIIYWLIREPVAFTDAATGHFSGTIWCYHYRFVDPMTGFGSWTRFQGIGGGVVETGGINSYQAGDRATAIATRNVPGALPKLLVGLRIWDGNVANAVDDGSVYVESDTLYVDTANKYNPITTAIILWSWQSGFWNAGIMFKQKLFYAITAMIKKISGAGNELGISHSVDGSTLVSQDYSPDQLNVDHDVGIQGEELSVKFSNAIGGGANTSEFELFGYTIDAEPVGQT